VYRAEQSLYSCTELWQYNFVKKIFWSLCWFVL